MKKLDLPALGLPIKAMSIILILEKRIVVITFETLRKIRRQELNTQKLSKLPEGFFKEVQSYLKQKTKLGKEDKKQALELKNAEIILEEIMNLRERKMMDLALLYVRTKMIPENLVEEEKPFFEELCELLEKRRELIKRMHEVKEKVRLVMFKEPVPKFVGIDLKVYGPFKPGDIAKLPEDNVEALLKAGKVEVFESEVA